MVAGSQLTPNIRLINPQTGLLTAEGFRFFQAIAEAVSGGGTFQPLNTILTGLSGMGTGTGLVAQTTAASFLKRTLVGSSPILIADGNGVAGNPTFTGDIATNAEAIAGTDTTKIIVSSALAAALAAAGGSYQPLAAALTSWAAIVRSAGFDTFVATPSSANFAALLTDETGTAGTVPFASSGSWTPSLTFAVPGDLSVAFTTQIGEYYRVGDWINLYFWLQTSTFTHTTASGNLFVTGNPFTAKTLASMRWNGSMGQFQGVTKANFTQFMPGINSAGVNMSVAASGSAQTTGTITAADMPTGTTKIFAGSVSFPL